MAAIDDFNASVNKFIKTIPERANDIKTAVALRLLERIVDMTPVDTGRARGNWTVSVDSPRLDATKRKTKSGSSAVMAGAAVIATVTGGQSIWINNNLPYIERLENGYSNQAPAGMLSVSLAEVGSSFQ